MDLKQLIIDYIDHSALPVENKDVAKKFDLSTAYTSRLLAELCKDGVLKRLPGTGRGYRYVVAQVLDSQETIEPSQLYEMLRTWAKVPWEPKIFKTAQNLPASVAFLYDIAARVAYGESVDPQELLMVYNSLNDFKIALESALRVVNLIQETSQLMHLDEIGEFLLQGKDVTVVQETAKKVIDLNCDIDSPSNS